MYVCKFIRKTINKCMHAGGIYGPDRFRYVTKGKYKSRNYSQGLKSTLVWKIHLWLVSVPVHFLPKNIQIFQTSIHYGDKTNSKNKQEIIQGNINNSIQCSDQKNNKQLYKRLIMC